ncbi:MAG: lysine--tRNA ligase [Planctomycetales bacterium]|nr:lysine--tRNA ligase [Planctomycetales bacterium]
MSTEVPVSHNETPPETPLDPHAARRAKLQKIVEMGLDPYGSRFDGRQSIADIRQRIGEVKLHKEDGTQVDLPDPERLDGDFRVWLSEQGPGELVGPKVRAAGRIVLSRDKGKLKFIDIRDQTGQVQLFVGKNQVGEQAWELANCFDLGDLIGVDGELRRTKTGELTIFVADLHILCKTLEQPPEKHKGLKDPEMRQRMRYVDLTYGDGVMQRFLERTEVVRSVRDTLSARGFCEVEGPTLHAIAGGAAARPFITHHNTLDIELYLRIALELHLKRLLVGGIERVYELGRVYRNEGISPRHNPEFTMLEVYEAYGNYETMMDLTEAIILDAIETLGRGQQLPWGEQIIDFSPPFARRTYNELFAECTGVDPWDVDAIAKLAASLGVETANRHPDVIKNDVFEEKVEDSLMGPVFVTDYPASICPLTKRKADAPEIAERFELFIQGMEVANAYTELNDPDLQEELFRTQLAGMDEEDSMARMDHDFVRALRYGMPPAGGLGIGIDRLVMLLTNTQTIRDIILFPLLREEKS